MISKHYIYFCLDNKPVFLVGEFDSKEEAETFIKNKHEIGVKEKYRISKVKL
jgi:hypothetical protein